MATRRSRWTNYSVEGHLGLIDDDLDTIESKFDADFVTLTAKLDGLRTILIGVLISLTTASIIGAANLVFK